VLPSDAHAAPQEHKKHAPLEGFKYDIEASEGRVTAGGSAKKANVDQFPISQSMAGRFVNGKVRVCRRRQGLAAFERRNRDCVLRKNERLALPGKELERSRDQHL